MAIIISRMPDNIRPYLIQADLSKNGEIDSPEELKAAKLYIPPELLPLFISQIVESEPVKYKFSYDLPLDFLPEAGSNNTISAYKLFNNYALNPLSDSLGFGKNWYGRIGRLILNEAWAIYMGGVQHEVYGHGGRNREAGCEVTHDFSLWRGKWGQSVGNCPGFTAIQNLLAASGGVEATQVLSKKVGQEMQLNGPDVFDAIFYASSKLDISNYSLIWDNPSLDVEFPFSNEQKAYPNALPDVSSYWEKSLYRQLDRLVKEYPVDVALKRWNTQKFSYYNIPIGAVYNMLDPHLLLALYSSMKYVVAGEASYKIPSFLPRTGFLLGPDGPLYSLSLPFVAGMGGQNMLIEPYINATINTKGELKENAFGFGAEILNVVFPGAEQSKIIIGASAHVFRNVDGWGGGGSLGVEFDPNEDYFPSLGIEFLGKSEGYIPGLPFGGGISASVTLGVKLPGIGKK